MENQETGPKSERAGTQPLPPLPNGDQEVVSAEVWETAQKELLECLKATRPVWSKDKKDFIMEADYPTRMAAVRLAFEYKIGRPVERRLQLTANADTWDATKQRQLKSPEGIRFLLAAGAITEPEAKKAMKELENLEEAQ